MQLRNLIFRSEELCMLGRSDQCECRVLETALLRRILGPTREEVERIEKIT